MSNNNIKEPFLDQQQSQQQYVTIGIWQQIKLLTYKNLLITFKNPKNIFFIIITPFILSLFLYGFQKLAENNANQLIPNPQPQPAPTYQKCKIDGCVSLDIRLIANTSVATINDQPWIKAVVQDIQSAGIDMNIATNPITNFLQLQAYYSQVQQKVNKVQAGLIFCVDKNYTVGDDINNFCNTTKDHTYYLFLKKINALGIIFHAINEPFPLDPNAIALKTIIDNAILKFQTPNGTTPATIFSNTNRFPLGPNRYIQNYDIVTSIGAFYYMITPLFVFLFLQNEIVRQKQYKLRQGLNIFGAKHTAYWISWFIMTIIYAFLTSLSTYLAGLSFGFLFFIQTPFYIIIFMLYFPFTISLAMISFFISTLAPTLKAANASSYAIVLLAIVVQSFVSDNNILTFIFTTDPSAVITALKVFLVIYPPFSYTKIFTNITVYSGYHFDIYSRSWIKGQKPYDMSIFVKQTSGPLPFGGGSFDRYSDLGSMFILYGDALFYAFLAWYCDHIISQNRGRSQSIFFPIKKILKALGYYSKKQKKLWIIPAANNDNYQQSAIKQRNRVYQNSQNNIPALGLRIKSLDKTFKKMCAKNELKALNDLTVQIQPNELMAVLGHNGAGKTTLINILTGILDPDQTDEMEIIINNQSIEKIDQIRKHIGLCAQFDILWEELTAEQHLALFAQLKGVPKQKIPSKIQQLLELVSLGRQGKNQIKGFSGGMKRRLSLAISAIGDPKIILLDEPTTGLDPKVRQQIWALVQKLKKNKSIILTTHSMQEADILADRVCVMVKGMIKCIGTTVYLKKKYGLGHRLNINIDREQVAFIMQTLKKLSPSVSMIDYKGGNLVVGVDQFQSLIKIIKMLESQQSQGLQQYELKKSIKDWSVSQATLQEVFMSVSKQKQQ